MRLAMWDRQKMAVQAVQAVAFNTGAGFSTVPPENGSGTAVHFGPESVPPEMAAVQCGTGENPSVYAGATARTACTAEKQVFPFALSSEGWEGDFNKWALKHCVFRELAWGGLKALDNHFQGWALVEGVPCTPEVFDALVRSEGFSVEGGFIYGLILKEDLWAVRRLK